MEISIDIYLGIITARGIHVVTQHGIRRDFSDKRCVTKAITKFDILIPLIILINNVIQFQVKWVFGSRWIIRTVAFVLHPDSGVRNTIDNDHVGFVIRFRGYVGIENRIPVGRAEKYLNLLDTVYIVEGVLCTKYVSGQ